MKINEVTSTYGRDFYAIYGCEHCDFTKKSYGYDDANFHCNVIPSRHCDGCGKNRAGEMRAATVPQ